MPAAEKVTTTMPLQVLHLDDDLQDAELVAGVLATSEFECAICYCRTGADFLRALAELRDLDVILADYSLPSFTGLMALDEVMHRRPEVPFIFVTGTMGEEAAVEAVQRGAADYVLKQRLSRLVPAIRRALAESQERNHRRRAESELRASEERFRFLYDHNPILSFTLQPDGVILSANQFAAAQLGYHAEELIGLSLLVTVAPEFHARTQDRLREIQRDGIGLSVWEVRKVRKDGTTFWVRETIRYLLGIDGRPILLVVCEDITERRTAADALRTRNELLSAVTEGAGDGLFAKDPEGRYLMINRAGARILGKRVEDILGGDDRQLVHPEVAAVWQSADRTVLASGNTLTVEETVVIEGESRVLSVTEAPYRDGQGRIVGIIGISRDITDRRRLEEHLRQAHKMEAINRLAGGIAHEFNNLLTVIGGYAQVLLAGLAPGDQRRLQLEEVKKASDRASGLTQQLMAFSGKQTLDPQLINLNGVIMTTERMLRPMIGGRVELTTQLDPRAGSIRAVPGYLEQIVMNLVLNARDAMPAGGRMTIETRKVELTPAQAGARLGLVPGPYVRLAVRDAGCGMDQETKSHLFEPFFTTKGEGKASGLGLATVYGIVQQSRGAIEVDTEVGRGTTVTVFLPCASAEASDRRDPDPVRPTGFGTVLLVEDEEPVRKFTSRLLKKYGFEVLEAASGPEALAVSHVHEGPIHLLVADVLMPQIKGPELSDLLLKARPSMKVLFMSGYEGAVALCAARDRESHAFIAKPFVAKVFLEKVCELLGVELPEADGG